MGVSKNIWQMVVSIATLLRPFTSSAACNNLNQPLETDIGINILQMEVFVAILVGTLA